MVKMEIKALYGIAVSCLLIAVYFVIPGVRLAKSLRSLRLVYNDGADACLSPLDEQQRFVGVMTYFAVLLMLMVVRKLFDDIFDETPLFREFYILLYAILQTNSFFNSKVLYRGVLRRFTSRQLGFYSALPRGLQDLPRQLSLMTPKIRDSPMAFPGKKAE